MTLIEVQGHVELCPTILKNYKIFYSPEKFYHGPPFYWEPIEYTRHFIRI